MILKTVYQTLEDRDDDLDKLESNGPYPCRIENTWLGDGYYFWDTFVENAHWWGKEVRKYPNGYIICKAICDFNDDECLDLQGNMEQLKNFKDSFEFSKSMGKVDNNTTVKMFLAFLKGENKAFNFSAIRVNGVKSNKMEKEQINLLVKHAAKTYSESPATTNAGRWLRLIVKYIPTDLIIKAFAHKLTR